MRLCRYQHEGREELGFYSEERILPLRATARLYAQATHQQPNLPETQELIDFLPPNGRGFAAAQQIAAWTANNAAQLANVALPTASTQLLVPIPRPNKLFLLAGNYAAHIQEGGGMAPERQTTFPYVFMKPPSTTLTNPGQPVLVPRVSPNNVDWELELTIVIGQRIKGVREADALRYVAGYTVINDISDRRFRPNPQRVAREKDSFFDWLHGKWHDSFCPCGPCITSADAIPDPQRLEMKLKVNGQIKQDASTALQIFPVAAVIEFISSFVTLEPGDLIATGTPSGVGNATGTFLHHGDRMEAYIQSIGTLNSVVQNAT